MTDLHRAARLGHTDIVKVLLEEGQAEVNVADKVSPYIYM